MTTIYCDPQNSIIVEYYNCCRLHNLHSAPILFEYVRRRYFKNVQKQSSRTQEILLLVIFYLNRKMKESARVRGEGLV